MGHLEILQQFYNTLSTTSIYLLNNQPEVILLLTVPLLYTQDPLELFLKKSFLFYYDRCKKFWFYPFFSIEFIKVKFRPCACARTRVRATAEEKLLYSLT